MSTAIEERVEKLKQSIKHNKKIANRLHRLISKDLAELKKLEDKICVCPHCNKTQELPSQKATVFECKFCGKEITKIED